MGTFSVSEFRDEFNDVGGFTIIKAGTVLPVVIDDATYKVSQNGNEMITIKLVVTEGDYARRMFWHTFLPFHEKRFLQIMFAKFLEGLGLNELSEEKIRNPEWLLGKRLNVKVGVGKDMNGDPRNQIGDIILGSTAEVTPNHPKRHPGTEGFVKPEGNLDNIPF